MPAGDGGLLRISVYTSPVSYRFYYFLLLFISDQRVAGVILPFSGGCGGKTCLCQNQGSPPS